MALTGVEISFDLPAGSFESSSSGGVHALRRRTRVSCDLGTVAPGETVAAVRHVHGAHGRGHGLGRPRRPPTGRRGNAANRRFTRADSDATGVAAAGEPGPGRDVCERFRHARHRSHVGRVEPAVDERRLLRLDRASLHARLGRRAGEDAREPRLSACGQPCTTQVSFVTIPALPEPATVMITFERQILAPGTKPRNFVLWETPDKYPAKPIRRVQACPLPAGEDSCIVKVSKYRRKGIQVVLQVVGTGEDPRYAGRAQASFATRRPSRSRTRAAETSLPFDE